MIQNNLNTKKAIRCPYCHNENSNGPIVWNTLEEETIAGNRTIICPDCGMHIIVPFYSPVMEPLLSKGIYSELSEGGDLGQT